MNPELEIESLEIIQINDKKVKRVYPVEYIKDQVDYLIKWHVKDYKLRLETQKCKEIRY